MKSPRRDDKTASRERACASVWRRRSRTAILSALLREERIPQMAKALMTKRAASKMPIAFMPGLATQRNSFNFLHPSIIGSKMYLFFSSLSDAKPPSQCSKENTSCGEAEILKNSSTSFTTETRVVRKNRSADVSPASERRQLLLGQHDLCRLEAGDTFFLTTTEYTGTHGANSPCMCRVLRVSVVKQRA